MVKVVVEEVVVVVEEVVNVEVLVVEQLDRPQVKYIKFEI